MNGDARAMAAAVGRRLLFGGRIARLPRGTRPRIMRAPRLALHGPLAPVPVRRVHRGWPKPAEGTDAAAGGRAPRPAGGAAMAMRIRPAAAGPRAGAPGGRPSVPLITAARRARAIAAVPTGLALVARYRVERDASAARTAPPGSTGRQRRTLAMAASRAVGSRRAASAGFSAAIARDPVRHAIMARALAPRGPAITAGLRQAVAPADLPVAATAAPPPPPVALSPSTPQLSWPDQPWEDAAIRPPSGISGINERLTPNYAGMVGPGAL